MLRNMTVSLLRHEEIRTTLPKAKELRRVAEPMITLGKKPSLANRRLAFDRLRDRGIVAKLFDDLGPRYANRNGGYLGILKMGFRKGENSPLALVMLMDRPDTEVRAGGDRRFQQDAALRHVRRNRSCGLPPLAYRRLAGGARRARRASDCAAAGARARVAAVLSVILSLFGGGAR